MYNVQGFLDKYLTRNRKHAQKVVDFFEKRKISCLLTDEIYDFFITNKTIGKTTFYVLKNVLNDFVDYVDDPDKEIVKKRIQNISQTDIAKRIDEKISFYKNLDEILNILNQIANDKGLHSSDITPLQSVAILIWHGYSDKQIIELKVSDIDSLEIDLKYKDILRTYTNLKYFRALPSGKVQNLLNSQYVFRTANSEQLTEFDIRKIISKINSIMSGDEYNNRAFSRYVLQKSRKFEIINQKYGDMNITSDIILKYFGKTLSKAEVDKTIIEYQKWRKLSSIDTVSCI